MVRKQIIWSFRAETELTGILEFYNNRNGNSNFSSKLLLEIKNLLNTLSLSESIGRLTVNKKTRVLVMKIYLIFYEINGGQIEIISFWDNRQSDHKKIEI